LSDFQKTGVFFLALIIIMRQIGQAIEPAIIAALISLTGVILSVAASLLASHFQIGAKIKEIRYEINREYAKNLNMERLKQYPAVYKELEELAFSIQQRSLNRDGFVERIDAIRRWYAEFGLLLGAVSNSRMYPFLRYMSSASRASNEAVHARIENHEKRKLLVQKCWSVQLALKNDIGVFGVEFHDPEKGFSTYREIDEELLHEDV
jgi:hypothetical protein